MTALADDAETADEIATLGSMASLVRLRRWLAPHRLTVIVMIVTACGAMLVQALIPLVTGWVVDGPIRHHDTAAIWPLAGLALVFGVAEAVLFFVRRYAMAQAALGVETDVRRDLFAHIQRLPASFHDRWASGQLLSRLTTDLSTVRRFVGFGFVFLVANSATAAVVIVLLLHIHLVLGLFVLIAMTPLAVFTRRFELRYSRDARRAQDLTGDLATSVEESALGIRVIKSYGRRPYMLRAFTGDTARLREAELRKIETLAGFWALLEGWPQLVLAGVTGGGVLAVAHHALSLGQLIAFLTLYLRLVWPIVSLGWLLALTQEAASAARRVFEVLDTQPSILDPVIPVAAGPRPPCALPTSGSAIPAQTPTCCAVLTSTSRPARRWRWSVPPGRARRPSPRSCRGCTTSPAARCSSAVWTCGTCGWRTCVTRWRSPSRTPPCSRQASARTWSWVGPVSPTRTSTEALEVAQAGFVYELPFGLDTRIGEQGLSLSGGQRQRLALARAVLGRPQLLVLDDPLSALDVHTEAQVERALRRVLAGTTALVVAHRPSTVLLADRVALLVDGRIAAVGTHRELLDTVPAYRDLLSQSTELEEVRT